VLLAYIHDPDEIEERPPLETMLADLSADQLRTLLGTLAARRPDLPDLIEAEVATLRAAPPPPAAPTPGAISPAAAPATPAAPRPRQVPIDPDTYRRQVRAVLRSTRRMSGSDAYWAVSGIVEEVQRIAAGSRPFLEAGAGRSALAILEGVTDEYLTGWLELDDSDGELGGLFEELGALWTEAILSADLDKKERAAWAKRLKAWQKEVDDYGIESAFDTAAEAARQGWDDPALRRVLQGEITKRGAWETEDAPDYADELALARLAVLARQGRTQEYLYLAEAEGQVALYVAMLAKLGRVEEAVSEALQYLGSTDDALLVAKALREHGAVAEALRVAEHGLTLQGHTGALARWLRDLAGGAGQPERGLAAALAVVRELPTLADWLAVAPLAGDRWPVLREELLGEIRATRSFYPAEQVQILLHEGEIDAALALVEPGGTHSMVELVMDAAINERPAWALNAGRLQALRIIDAGKAPDYGAAAEWLRKAGAAAKVAGREDEWRALIRKLLTEHSRKRNLVPLLENLLRRR
jgi:uncharacterized Zn finger protein